MEIGIDVDFTIDRRWLQVLFLHEQRQLSIALGKVKPVPFMLYRYALKRFCALEMKFAIILLWYFADGQGNFKSERLTDVAPKADVVPVYRARNANIISYGLLEELFGDR